MDKAGAALEAAEREHNKVVASIEKEREAVDRRASAEEDRWEKAKDRLERVLRNASR
jgi:colicin import membrane protein